MTVVYLDSVFLLNGVMDYLLCLITATLAGIPLRRKRYLGAAVLGGTYAICVFLPGMSWLTGVCVKAAVGMLMGVVAFGGEAHLGRLILLSGGVACAAAGSVLGLSLLTNTGVPMTDGIFYTDVSPAVLFLSAAGIYPLIRLSFRAAAKHGIQSELLRITVCIGGRKCMLTALWDTGNDLRNPLDGRPVLIVEPESIREILPDAAKEILTQRQLQDPVGLLDLLRRNEPQLCPQLIPYRAVGMAGGMLVAIRCDWIRIEAKRHERLLVALSPNTLGNGYCALWGGEKEGKGGKYEDLAVDTTAMEKAAGSPAGEGRHTLYWRQ